MADPSDLAIALSGATDLNDTDLQRADLSRRDLRGRTFRRANLLHANFKECDLTRADFTNSRMGYCNFENAILRNAVLPNSVTGANFKGADLRGNSAAKGIRSFNDCNFDSADVRGLEFSNYHFGGSCNFENIIIDAQTNFDGARMPRAAARGSLFSAYDYVDGVLKKRSTVAGEIAEGTETRDAESSNHATRIAVIGVFRREHSEIVRFAGSLRQCVVEELGSLENQKPNDPDALALFDRYFAYLKEIATSLEHIQTSLNGLSELVEANAQNEALAAAANSTLSMKDVLINYGNAAACWLEENKTKNVNFVFKTGLLGLGAVFLGICGAGYAAFPAAAVLYGEEQVAALWQRICKV